MFNEYTDLIDKRLFEELTADAESGNITAQAMLYSLKAGGKRIRPLFTILFCEACGGKSEMAENAATAVEYIHSYSLIHDDLPCMDNDDFRRGKPSCHKQFGEDVALLAGDALLTLAFEKIADGAKSGRYTADTAIRIISVLSSFSGYKGMIGGQALDLMGEGKDIDFDALKTMDLLKTGKLIKAACEIGCLAAGAANEQVKAASVFGENVGLAFQITDDILDVTGDFNKLGKLTGSDVSNNKSTYVKILGLQRSKEYAAELTNEALNSLNAFSYKKDELRLLALSLVNRER